MTMSNYEPGYDADLDREHQTTEELIDELRAEADDLRDKLLATETLCRDYAEREKELLTVLEEAVELFGRNETDPDSWEVPARAAIAKAKGGAS
jgi:hypothetical protein